MSDKEIGRVEQKHLDGKHTDSCMPHGKTCVYVRDLIAKDEFETEHEINKERGK